MLIVATGDGKGKTTAAIGQAIRAVGHGKRVFFAQFIKCDGYPSGEDSILREMGDLITFFKGGKGFVGICGDTLPFAEHKAAAEATLAACWEAAAGGRYDLVVCDEINVAAALKLVPIGEVLSFLDAVPDACDVVFTGRHADHQILRRADFITECVELKHPFHNRIGAKIAARKGVEY